MSAEARTKKPLYSDDDIPIMFEDEGVEMGESLAHAETTTILWAGIGAFLDSQPDYLAFMDLNLYYGEPDDDPVPYVSPDVMVVRPHAPLLHDIDSYCLGEQCPAPEFVCEVLSILSWQQDDLTLKAEVYAQMGVTEYLIADPKNLFLAHPFELRRLAKRGSWTTVTGDGNGVKSRLGFGVIVDRDGGVRVIDAKTKRPYLRPWEQLENRRDELAARLKHQRELDDRDQRIAELESEVRRLRRRNKK